MSLGQRGLLYLVVIPTRAVIPIRSAASGPPRAIPVTTPPIFRVPIVAEIEAFKS